MWVSFGFSLSLFIDLTSRLYSQQQISWLRAELSGNAVISLVGSSNDIFGLAVLPDDQAKMS